MQRCRLYMGEADMCVNVMCVWICLAACLHACPAARAYSVCLQRRGSLTS